MPASTDYRVRRHNQILGLAEQVCLPSVRFVFGEQSVLAD